jgi:ubiquinone/menaquinone biosynthesis C-methylase UbiE
MNQRYVHGYQPEEHERLRDQAATLADLLHGGTAYAPGATVLEAGCGVGAQTVTLANRSPDARITSIDLSATSLAEARRNATAASISTVEFLQADIFSLPFAARSFDHVFVCFVLEHLTQPAQALTALRRLLKPGGTITVIEGDHGSVIFHPDDPAAREAIGCLVELQRRAGGNALVGRELYPLLVAAGFSDVTVEPRMAYADASRPTWVEGFTRKTFTAMIAGVERQAVDAGLIAAEMFADGLRGLERTTRPDGMFGYTFFKAVARVHT